MTAVSPLWRALLEAALARHRDLPHTLYAQVATVRPDGRPANRTLVFRSFLDASQRLVFTSDMRSGKASHLDANSWVEVCWYFTNSREQFRLSGQASLSAEGAEGNLTEARRRIWRGLSDNSRQTFAWPSPGERRGSADEFERAVSIEPPPHFALLIVEPQQVDHLLLSARPHQRTIHQLTIDGEWLSTPVNP